MVVLPDKELIGDDLRGGVIFPHRETEGRSGGTAGGERERQRDRETEVHLTRSEPKVVCAKSPNPNQSYTSTLRSTK